MKTLERKTVEQPQKQIGQFATVEAMAAYKTAQAIMYPNFRTLFIIKKLLTLS